eukprot:GFYU01006208.1.p1 GENE.GFYU01006208.1~~GFYU01006208.1.p1  ORF type:complete len:169 (-),score=41.24 GFYU01006208.1:176-631(-)
MATKTPPQTPSSIYYMCAMGMVLSAYALYVEIKLSQDKNFVALCDISEWMSCSKVFSSKWGHMLFGVPNAFWGCLFYPIVALLTRKKVWDLVLLASAISTLGSCFLGYILIFVVVDICLVCMSIYVISFIMLYVVYNHRKAYKAFKSGKAE